MFSPSIIHCGNAFDMVSHLTHNVLGTDDLSCSAESTDPGEELRADDHFRTDREMVVAISYDHDILAQAV